MNNIKKLINELNEASFKYYNGLESPLTDKEFDLKFKELQQLEKETGIIYSNSPTQNVGAPVLNIISKISIQEQPMLSLDKVHSAKEIYNFESGYDIIASIKCDGLSVRIIYQDGKIFSANTRGNGYEGSDITEHIKCFLNVPLTINKQGTYIIDGEAIILKQDFDLINQNNQFQNSRNTASGSLALLDMSIVKNRRLSFYAWDIIKGGNYKEYHYNLEEAQELGFTVVPCLALDATQRDRLEEIDSINQDLLNEAKEKGIPCDGIVWRINDIQAGKNMGQTAHHFLNAIAWKPADDEYETELLDIEWSIGRTGQLTPVAIFKPVEIDGTIVERASLHNVSIMRETLGFYPELYQPIWVTKVNQIIPQVARANINDDYHDHVLDNGIITKCPYCGRLTKIIESDSGVLNAYCTYDGCIGKLSNRIDHFCGKKGLDIKGISLATIEKLIDWGWLNGLADVFRLNEHKAEWVAKPGFGAASVGKILNNIDAAKRGTQLVSFISAIGIPLVGRTVAKEIVKYYPSWTDFKEAVGEDWSQFEGFGPEISKAINSFDYTEADEIAEMLIFAEDQSSEEQTESPLKDKVFCVTGKLQNYTRDSIKVEIESLGGKVVGSISSKVNYLITNTPDSGTAKNKDAIKLGIPIITEEDFENLKKNS